MERTVQQLVHGDALGLQTNSLNCPRKGRRRYPASFLWQPWYALSTALVGDATIYRIQLPDRGSAPAHRVRLSFPLLSSLRVRDAMTRAPIGDAGALPDGTNAVLTLAPSEGLDEALEQLSESGMSEAIVVDQQRVIGRLSTRDIVAAYKTTLARGVRRTKRLGTESELLEAQLDAASPLVGKSLQEIVFPADTLVVSIARDG